MDKTQIDLEKIKSEVYSEAEQWFSKFPRLNLWNEGANETVKTMLNEYCEDERNFTEDSEIAQILIKENPHKTNIETIRALQKSILLSLIQSTYSNIFKDTLFSSLDIVTHNSELGLDLFVKTFFLNKKMFKALYRKKPAFKELYDAIPANVKYRLARIRSVGLDRVLFAVATFGLSELLIKGASEIFYKAKGFNKTVLEIVNDEIWTDNFLMLKEAEVWGADDE